MNQFFRWGDGFQDLLVLPISKDGKPFESNIICDMC
jgi:hypothetical protein